MQCLVLLKRFHSVKTILLQALCMKISFINVEPPEFLKLDSFIDEIYYIIMDKFLQHKAKNITK